MSVLGQAMGVQRERRANDFYPTIDPRVIPPLVALLKFCDEWACHYAEPCAGAFDLVHLIEQHAPDLKLEWAADRWPQRRQIARANALTLSAADLHGAKIFITNPPFERSILHKLIEHLARIAPTYFLFDSGWSATKQAIRLGERYCTDIIPIGRIKFFTDPIMAKNPFKNGVAPIVWKNPNDPPNDFAWYRFSSDKKKPTNFHWPVSKSEMIAAQNGQQSFTL